MPTQADVENYKTLMETGKCSCGHHIDEHVTSHDQLGLQDTIKCKLLRSEVLAWHEIRRA